MKAKKTSRNLLYELFSAKGKILAASLCVVWLSIYSAHANTGAPIPKKPAMQKAVDISLKQLEGFYQFPNKVAFIQFEQRDKNLLARQVWDNRTYLLVRKGDLHFESEEETYKIEFLKDSSGHISGVKILGRTLLTKVNYDPTKIAILLLNQLKTLEGTYQFERDKNLTITITAKGNGIKLKQHWDGKSIVFLPRSEKIFFNEDHSFPLTFVMDGKQTKQVICFANDVWNKIQ